LTQSTFPIARLSSFIQNHRALDPVTEMNSTKKVSNTKWMSKPAHFPFSSMKTSLQLSNLRGLSLKRARLVASLSAGLLSAVVCYGMMATGNAATGYPYTVSTIPLQSGNAISLPGVIVGDNTNAGGNPEAFSYFNGTSTDLGVLSVPGVTPSTESSNANSVNVRGLIVGDSTVPGQYTHAVIFSSGTVKDLGTINGGQNSTAAAINDLGQIIGNSNVSATDNVTTHAFVTTKTGALKDLGALTATGSSEAFGINDFGVIVGQSTTANGDVHGFTYQNNKFVDIGTLGGSTSAAVAVNLVGIVAGSASLTGDANTHAIVYYRGRISDLGVLSDGDSFALAINDLAQVVGVSGFNSTSGVIHAFLYSFGKLQDLNNLIDPSLGITLTSANAINDQGEIVVSGTDNLGNPATFLLTPSE
jgi:probable HAF family extracellular repeat protein